MRVRAAAATHREVVMKGIVIAGLVVVSSACGHGFGARTEAGRPLEPSGAVHVTVTNHSGGPMEIHAVGSGTSYRVGTVQPGLSERLVIRPGMIVNGPVEFVARSGHGPAFSSGAILLAPGDEVDLALGAQPVGSTATVRPRLAAYSPGAEPVYPTSR
jgi:hypothetical protein